MKVTAIRTKPYWYRTNRPFSDANFPKGRTEWAGLAVFIDTDEGLTGVSIGGYEAGVHALAPLVVGRDPRGVRSIWKSMVDQVFKGGNRGYITDALSAIDTALWDLKAKAENQPLWKLLGAGEGRARAYASDIGYCLTDDQIRAFYRRLRIMYEELARAVPGRRGGSPDKPTAAPIEPLICIDSNEYWNPKQAVSYIRTLEREIPLFWVEEPAERWDYEGLRKVSQGVEAQVATGENLDDPKEIVPLLTHGAVDVLEPSNRHSGITGMLMTSEIAYGFNIPVAAMNSPGHYLAHVAAALPNHLMMEVADAGRDNWFKVDSRIEGGDVVLGDRPGLGWEIDLDVLESLTKSPARNDAFNFGRRRGAGVLIHGEERLPE
jgi:L-alanine-DL-glutamate epimerase-like enolase superfamily enzyme